MLFNIESQPGQTMNREFLRCEWSPKDETWRDLSNDEDGCKNIATVQIGRYEWAHTCESCSKSMKLKCFPKKPVLYVKDLRETLENRKNTILRRKVEAPTGQECAG